MEQNYTITQQCSKYCWSENFAYTKTGFSEVYVIVPIPNGARLTSSNHLLRLTPPTNSSATAAFLSGNFILYCRLRNKVIRTAKSIRSSYYLEQLSSLRYCDPRRWWKHTKALTGLGKTSSNLHAMANSLCGGDLSTLAGKVN